VSGKALVVILAETRASELTFGRFKQNVLDKLGADLALCIGDNPRETPNEFYSHAKYIWKFEEPADWATAFDAYAQGRNWRCLLELQDQWLGGVKHPTWQHPGSAGILVFFREFLRRKVAETGILAEYDWIIITRSDFMWPAPYPQVELFSKDCIYFPDGERYRGYTDRHVMVPARLFEKFMQVPQPVFEDPEGLAVRMKALGKTDWNLESFIKFRLTEIGLRNRVRFFPYLMFAVRAADADTRWSSGTYSPELRLNVKYEFEYSTARIMEVLIPYDDAWKGMIGKARFLCWRFYLYALLRTLAERRLFAERFRALRLARRFFVYVLQRN
jgi:hypothetical protein